MAQQVGELVIRMAADVAQLKTDMAKAQKSVSDAMAGMERSIDLAKKALIAFTGIASINAFKNMVQGSIESTATLHDLAIQGQTTVDALSGLASVGKYSDTGAQQIVGAMGKLSRGLAGATEDSKGAGKALAALGIDFASFADQAPDQQMLMVAKAMDGFKDGSDKAAVAMALFGKEGAALLPFLQDLATVGTLQAKVTQEQANMADDYSDNLLRLRSESEAWKKQLSLGMLPALYETSQALLDVTTGVGGLKEEIGRLAKDGTLAQWTRASVTGVTYLLDGFIYLKRAVVTVIQTMTAGVAQAVQYLGGVGEAIGKLMTGDFKGALESVQGGYNRMISVGDEWLAQQEETWGSETLGAKLRARLGELNGYTGATDKAAKAALNFRNVGVKDQAAKEYDAAMKQVRKFISEREAELDQGKKLTDAQRLEIDLKTKLGAGYDAAIAKAIASAKAVENETLAQERYAKWLDESATQNTRVLETAAAAVQTYRDQADAAQELANNFGLTTEELYGLETAKMRDAAASLLQRQMVEDFNPAAVQMNALLRDQAAALNATADARDALAAKQDKASRDALTGAERGAKAYIDEISRAGDAASAAVQQSAKALEDSLTTFFTTGKFGAKQFVTQLISEFMRLAVVRPLLSGLGSAFGFGGGSAPAAGGGGGTFGVDSISSIPQAAVGINYVPYDGFIASLHEGERVVPKGQANQGMGSVSFDFSGMSIGDGVSASAVQAAMNQAVAIATAQMRDQQRRTPSYA